MKLIILKNNLKSGLDSVGRAIGSNLNLPILGNVLIKTLNNQIKLSTTNLELAITKNVFGKVVEDGGITVPYGVLANIINNINSERINLESKQNNLLIKTDNYEATIQGISENEFPIIPKIKEGREFVEISAAVLKESLEKVIIAAVMSELRPEISGVLFINEHPEIKLVATDSFRLAESKILNTQFKNSFEKGFRLIIPLKTAQELLKIIKDEDLVSIYLDNNQILFKTNDLEVISRLIDGNFPDYEAIIPKSVATEILIKRDEFINAVKLISSFTSRISDIRLKTEGGKVLEAYSNDNALGENKYLVPAKITGPDVELSFNPRFLLEGLKTNKSEQVYLGFNGENKPAFVKTPGDVSCFYIVMPIRQ